MCVHTPSQNIEIKQSRVVHEPILASVNSSGAHTHRKHICELHHSLMLASRIGETRARKTVVSLGSRHHLYPVYHLLFEEFTKIVIVKSEHCY